MNSVYKNIFKLDFTPESQVVNLENSQPANNDQTTPPKDSTTVSKPLADTLKPAPTSAPVDSNAIALSDTNSMKKVKDKIEEVKKVDDQLASKALEKANASMPKQTGSKRDSTYKNWIKNTAKIYTSMDTKKAAKIIQGYSDNIARDLLLTMKKKKAADIIAEFKPDVATRIISAQQ